MIDINCVFVNIWYKERKERIVLYIGLCSCWVIGSNLAAQSLMTAANYRGQTKDRPTDCPLARCYAPSFQQQQLTFDANESLMAMQVFLSFFLFVGTGALGEAGQGKARRGAVQHFLSMCLCIKKEYVPSMRSPFPSYYSFIP